MPTPRAKRIWHHIIGPREMSRSELDFFGPGKPLAPEQPATSWWACFRAERLASLWSAHQPHQHQRLKIEGPLQRVAMVLLARRALWTP